MSTATNYEALRPAPPLGQQRQQFAPLLAARDAARRTLDLLLSAPRGAWTLLRRVTAGWFSRILPTSAQVALRRMLAPVAWLRSVTAVVGLLPLVGVALTTRPVQGLVAPALGVVGRLTVKAGGALWRAADAGLRFFGTSGSRLADRLAAAGRRFVARAATLATDPRAQLLVDACRTAVQVVGPLSRAVVVHRLLGRLVSPRWLRSLLELALVPVLLDRHLTRSIRTWLEAALRRVAGDRQPATVVVIPIGHDPVSGPSAQAAATAVSPARIPAPEPLPVVEGLAMPADNRAGRRAAQRQEAQAKKARPTR